MQKFSFMRLIFRFKWFFLIIGFRMAGGRGAFWGFLLGCLIDAMISPPTIRFRVYTNRQRESSTSDLYTYVDTQLENAYRTLEIDETATDDEVRKAYRRLALMYHPDRVASQGERAKSAAESTFQRINQAKEVIFKARGLR